MKSRPLPLSPVLSTLSPPPPLSYLSSSSSSSFILSSRSSHLRSQISSLFRLKGRKKNGPVTKPLAYNGPQHHKAYSKAMDLNSKKKNSKAKKSKANKHKEKQLINKY